MNATVSGIAGLLNRPEPLTWLFAGDSIVQGALHTMGWRDYTELFRERVRWEIKRYRDCVINTAVSGWRVGNLIDDLEWSIKRHQPHIVFVGVGMNDCADGPDGVERFRDGYTRLVTEVQKSGAVAVVLQTPNRVLPSDTLRHPHLGAYAAVVREVAEHAQTGLIDHFAAWEPAERSGSMAYWLSDPSHPNECGHRYVAHTIFRSLGLWDEHSRCCRLFVP